MTISSTRQGGRRIELYLPFTIGRKRIKAITLRPLRWDQTIKWQEGGHYQTAMQLLFDVADQPEEVLREIRYPDVERIIMMFVDLLPNEIRESVAQNITPQPRRELDTEKVAELIRNMEQERQVPEPMEEQFFPEPELEPEPTPAPAPESEFPSPEEYDKTIKAALAKGEQPWPGYPWAPGTPGPEIPTTDDKLKPKPEAAETGVGFDL